MPSLAADIPSGSAGNLRKNDSGFMCPKNDSILLVSFHLTFDLDKFDHLIPRCLQFVLPSSIII